MFTTSSDGRIQSDPAEKYVQHPKKDIWENDVALWKAFKESNESAFVEIYHRYFQVLFNYGNQISNDNEFCQDVIQNLFIKLRRKRPKLHKVRSIKAFLMKCFRNELISEIRSSKKMSTVEFLEDKHNFQLIPSHETVLINRQLGDELLQAIRDKLSNLPYRQREAIHLFYYNNMSYQEIREVMNFSSVPAARNLIYRAINSLKEELQDY